jgi:hypothetical protein
MEQMRQSFYDRTRMRREEQLRSIKTIQEQLIKLKAAIEATDPRAFEKYRDMSEEDKSKVRDKIAQSRTDYNKAIVAIQQALLKLGGQRPKISGVSTEELIKIRELAMKEKAKLTAKSLDTLIAKQKSKERGRWEIDTDNPRKSTRKSDSRRLFPD